MSLSRKRLASSKSSNENTYHKKIAEYQAFCFHIFEFNMDKTT
jgi:hypothetical protein